MQVTRSLATLGCSHLRRVLASCFFVRLGIAFFAYSNFLVAKNQTRIHLDIEALFVINCYLMIAGSVEEVEVFIKQKDSDTMSAVRFPSDRT